MIFLNTAFFTIKEIFSGGAERISQYVTGLFIILFLLELLFIVLKGWTQGEAMGGPIIKLFMATIICIIMSSSYTPIMKKTANLFTHIGLTAGGNGNVYKEDEPGPVAILGEGLLAADPLYKAANKSGMNFGSALFYWFAWFIMMGCYVLITAQFFLIYSEFFILMGIGRIFVPAALFRGTRYISEKFIGTVIAHGIKILLFNFILGVVGLILRDSSQKLRDNLAPDIILCTITIAIILFLLVKHIPQMASGIIAGTPTLSSPTAAGLLSGAALVGASAMVGAKAFRAGIQGMAIGGVKLGGGLAKAVGAGVSSFSAHRLNMDAAGLPATRGAATFQALKSGLYSAGGSIGSSLLSGAQDVYRRVLHGKNYSKIPALQKPDSLKSIGSSSKYLANRYNQGKEAKHIEPASHKRTIKASRRAHSGSNAGPTPGGIIGKLNGKNNLQEPEDKQNLARNGTGSCRKDLSGMSTGNQETPSPEPLNPSQEKPIQRPHHGSPRLSIEDKGNNLPSNSSAMIQPSNPLKPENLKQKNHSLNNNAGMQDLSTLIKTINQRNHPENSQVPVNAIGTATENRKEKKNEV